MVRYSLPIDDKVLIKVFYQIVTITSMFLAPCILLSETYHCLIPNAVVILALPCKLRTIGRGLQVPIICSMEMAGGSYGATLQSSALGRWCASLNYTERATGSQFLSPYHDKAQALRR